MSNELVASQFVVEVLGLAQYMRGISVLCLLFVTALISGAAESNENIAGSGLQTISLTVDAGLPLRVYLTRRLPKRLDEPVHAKVLEPVFAFDREVIPAGADVIGRVSRLDPVSKMKRASAVLGGDFTPLHDAEVEFTSIILPGGRAVAVHTTATFGLATMYSPPRPGSKNKPPKAVPPPTNTGVMATAKQEAKRQVNAKIAATTRGVADLVRGPDKLEKLQEFLVMKLPYHPQWVRKGTRFDGDLQEPLQFGNASFKADTLQMLGTPPPADSVVHARLITALNSSTSKRGEKVEALVTQPLFSTGNRLVLPPGTRLSGAVTSARPSRWFHRGGQLRFDFQTLELPDGIKRPVSNPVVSEAVSEAPPRRLMATLESAESGNSTQIKVDSEGGVKAVESKTRLIAPALAALIAARTMDNDAERAGTHEGSGGGARTLGGGSGFGLLGAAAAQSSRTLGSVLGFYGMGWSVYSNIVARGGEVEFRDNAAVDIRFGSRKPAPVGVSSKLRNSAGGL